MPRATSFIVVSGPLGHRRVRLLAGKQKANEAWVNLSQFMQAVSAVGYGPLQVTLANVPCRFKPVANLIKVTCKKKATHGIRHGVNGRQKYNRSKVENYY